MSTEKHEGLISLDLDRELSSLIHAEAILEDCSEEIIIKRAFSLYEVVAQEMRTGGMLAVIRKTGRDEPGKDLVTELPNGSVEFDIITWLEDGEAES